MQLDDGTFEILAAAAAATMAETSQRTRAPVPVKRPARVAAKGADVVPVLVLGDSVILVAQNLTGVNFSEGDRVMVEYGPGGTLFVVGQIATVPVGVWQVIRDIPTLTVAGPLSFQGIPPIYKSLRLEVHGRSSSTPGTVYETTWLKINNDGGANYYDHEQQASNATTAGVGPTNRTGAVFVGYSASSNSTTARAGHQIIEIPTYRETVFAAHSGWWASTFLDSTSLAFTGGWYWAPAAMVPINRLDVLQGGGLAANWAVGSWARLWAAA